MKKLFAVLMAFALVLSMGTTVLAAGDGVITIEKAVVGADYEIYKMLNFTPSNDAGDKGIYTIEAGWENFFATAPATDYFTVAVAGGQTTVSLKDGVTEVDQTLAKAALKYAEDNTIDATATATATAANEGDETTTVTFNALDYGKTRHRQVRSGRQPKKS